MTGFLRALRGTALVVAISLLASPAGASTVVYRTDSELIALSERVVHARVIAQRAEWGGPQHVRIYTVTTLAILEDFTGFPAGQIDVWELGGQIGDQIFHVGGGVQYRVGEEIVVCLERGPYGLRSVAMNFSRFDVARSAAASSASPSLQRRLADTIVQGAPGTMPQERTLDEFRALAAQVTGRPSVKRTEPLLSVQEPFTKLGGEPGFRWIQADTGTPVRWYKNTSASSPLLSGNAVAEIQTALAAWTDPPSASLILQYAGETNQSDADGPWPGLPSNGTGAGLITFEDPNNELSGSTLAIGGAAEGISFGGGTVNGTTFHGFRRGFVIFQNAADLAALSPSYRQSLNFTRVLEHEIGHAIGLGHTQTDGVAVPNPTQNIMYPSCCHAATPTPPAIGPDDLTGLNFIYPSGSSSCTYSINPTSAAATAGTSVGSVAVTTQPGCGWSASSNSGFLTVTSGTPGSGSGTLGYNVAANGSSVPRSGTLSIAGHTFTVTQSGAICSYTLTPGSASVSAGGGTGSVNVSAPGGCAWTAMPNAGFLSITSGSSGAGVGTVNYSVSSNGVSFRSGTLTIAGLPFTVNQTGTGPMVTLDKSSLRFGATLSGTNVTSQTTAQTVRLAQSAGAAVSWTATSNAPWLVVSPTSGSGTQDLSVSVNPASLPVSTTLTAAITITLTGAGNIAGPIDVALQLIQHGTSAAPIGLIDTPVNNTTGVTGAIPVTGWALDDVEVSNVFICRAAVSGEAAPVDPNCGGAAQIFVGGGVFIDGTRPDVQAGAPTYPRNGRAGWGFLVLTNMLPSQGNGTFTFYAYAVDRDGHVMLLGTRTITCDNAHATTPFGTIDTPGQGDTAAGNSYVNFGWALTQQPKNIPTDGSTITVFVDGHAIGSPDYNHYRADIATLFPGYANSNGAVGFRVIDTTALTNGLHTIVWTATDSAGMTGGLGSRFFRVANGGGSSVAAAEASVEGASLSVARLSTVAVDRASLVARRGWTSTAPWQSHATSASGRAVIRGEELDRFEIWLGNPGAGRYAGYLRVGNALSPLPVGSRLGADSGNFTWSPGLGFAGAYDFVFVRWQGSAPVARQEVRVILHPKGSGHVGSQVVIDAPAAQQDVAQPFVLAGWAADLDAPAGSGIDTLHVWAFPLAGGSPVFLGTPAYGGARPDVAAVHGDQFRESGYGLIVDSLPHGNYDLAVFAWSNVSGGFVPGKVVRVTVR